MKTDPKSEKDNGKIKFEVHDSHKKKKDKHRELERKPDGKSERRKDGTKSSSDTHKKETHKESRHDNAHRKEKNRTELTKSDNKKEQEKSLKHRKKQQKQSNSSGGGMSFMDLMKLAKCNSENPGSGKVIQKKESLKRPAPKEEPAFDPDRHVKVKKKQISAVPSNSKRNDKIADKSHHISKEKVKTYSEERRKDQKKHQQGQKQQLQQHDKIKNKQNVNSNKIRPVKTNVDLLSGRKEKPVQRGLVVETVSSSKKYDDRIQKQRLINNAQPRSINRGGGGIAAQNRGVDKVRNKNGKPPKRTADDFENEFEKEEKMLAKKRRLFEMRRITGLCQENYIAS